MRRRSAAFAAIAVGCLAVVGTASPASAHPLGNATVNHYDGLHVYPDRVTDLAVEDIAEIPTVQRKPLIDTDRDGTISATEASTYARSQCASLARADRISVGGRPLALSVRSSAYNERPGAIQLLIGRLTCQLQAPASIDGPTTLAIDDHWDGAGIGWHEITAVATGVTLRNSPFPARSISDELLHYPNNLLSSPIDVRSGSVALSPGAAASTYAANQRIPEAGGLQRALDHVTNTFNALVGRKHVTIGAGLLALLLAVLLGAGHACLPGHGKTIMAAYLVGRRGRLRDVAAVGATVTVTHTAGVLILGAVLSASTAFAPTAAEQDLAIGSGLLVAGIGVGLLVSAIRRRRAPGPLAALAAPHGHSHDHDHDHDHDHGHGSAHAHPHPHRHPHGESNGFSRGGLVGLGVAGGLVPSPSALLVLLATIALGRTSFGVVLVLGYGLGMAAALCAAGLLLVRLRSRIAVMATGRLALRADWALAALPVLTAGLVTVVGFWLTLRALGGTL